MSNGLKMKESLWINAYNIEAINWCLIIIR